VVTKAFRLAESLIDLAESLESDENDYRRRVVQRVSDLVEPADVGLLLAGSAGRLTKFAAQTWRTRHLLRIESRLQEGPCTTSHRTGQRLEVDLDSDADWRWPRFTPEARGAGFLSAIAIPLVHQDDILGAVSILAPCRITDADLDIDLAATLVEAAAVGIAQSQVYRTETDRAEMLQDTLDSRVLLEQAKGILAAQARTTPDEAYELMRCYAQDRGQLLQDVAKATIRGRLHADALVAAAPESRRGA
jgi:transcriptional regulator with GAF, ATPase, and Fis domain